MLELRRLDSRSHADYIRQVRTRTLEALQVTPAPAMIEPLPHAFYVAAYAPQHEEPIGLGEAYLYRKAFASYADSPMAGVPGLAEACPIEHLCYMRTIYVDPAYRGVRPAYLYLYLVMSHLFRVLGADYALMATMAEIPALAGLYAKTGGKQVGKLSFPNTDATATLYLFNLKELLVHPRLVRALASIHFEDVGGKDPHRAERLARVYRQPRAVQAEATVRAAVASI